MSPIRHGLRKILTKLSPAFVAGVLSVCVVHSVSAAPSQLPLFLTAPVKPILMLNMSNDHQLFFKVYDDYSDITGDGVPDTSYVHSYDYYGYFNSEACYVYQNNRFEPVSKSSSKFCSGQWSGNFLNWATMTRVDVVRKILYGGLRQVDTAAETVLERTMLPNDAHSFTKYYNGPDIERLTPFDSVTSEEKETAATGITICNTTDPATRNQFSHVVNDPPLMRIARGNYSLWASNERWQCRWGTNSNGNDSAVTDIFAYGSSPVKSSAQLGSGDYNVRVKVCASPAGTDAGSLNEDNCEAYGVNTKPRGLLQEFGRDDSMLFGLMTGSYGRNKSGGVLRKNAALVSDEINADGTFRVPGSGESIIEALDLLRIYGYNFNDGIYNSPSGDDCPWARSSFVNGRCTNWGNPQSEIYLESLRYLAGLTATADFVPASPTDGGRITGLPQASWQKPVTQNNYCAPLSVLQFNASTVSYDSDELAGSANIGLSSVNDATDHVGAQEGIHGGTYFVGQTALNTDQLCTPKLISNLSAVRGTCPDAPRLQGSYQIAGLAHHARRTGIDMADLVEHKKVITYGVSLAPAVPRVTVPVPTSTGDVSSRSITILPACRNRLAALGGNGANCAIVDFKVFNQESEIVDGVHVNTGSLYVNWEDSEQGGDYDQDMWGIIEYVVSSDTAVVTSRVVAQSTGDPMGFGYVISGTTEDGFHVHSGVNNFNFDTSCTAVDGNRCTCRVSGTAGSCDNAQAAARSKTFNIGASTAQSLREPLYYAAKWGGYSKEEEDDAVAASIPLDTMVLARDSDRSYFYATDPRELEESLRDLFLKASEGIGVASSAATNSTRLNEGSRLYQALFNSADWSGTLKAWSINPQTKDLTVVPGATTDNYFVVANGVGIDSGRRIFTYNDDTKTLVNFTWDNLSDWQKDQLMENVPDTEVLATARLNWIRGNRAGEGTTFRPRTNLLGDIVNSNPVFSGNPSPRYTQLPTGGASYRAYAETKAKVLYVGANDGMLHAFNAETFEEIFAYVPNGVYPKLANLTKPNYGGIVNPHQSLVDGPLYVSDAYLASRGGWRTILVGTLGGGGRGVFALDVTVPTNPEILFEFDTGDHASLGYIMGQPLIAPLSNGRWAAIFGNGYEAGTSRLFVVDLEAPENPAYTRVIDTGAGTGLSGPSLLPNLTAQIDYAYAGDLNGNVWKFNLISSQVAYGGVPLFIARDAANNVQPITGGLTLGINEQLESAIMVYFGTGKYFESGDNLASPTPVHSFYAVADLDPQITPITRAVMHQKTLAEVSGARVVNGERQVTTGGIISLMDWSAYNGWYLDFGLISGERVVTKPVLLMDRLIFNTIIPSPVPCEYGGRSFAMELVAVGDRNLGHSVLGESANSELDQLVVGEPSVVAGRGGEETGVKVDCDVEGNCESQELTFWGSWRGRMNWREFR